LTNNLSSSVSKIVICQLKTIISQAIHWQRNSLSNLYKDCNLQTQTITS
jgi:hypothetical protein